MPWQRMDAEGGVLRGAMGRNVGDKVSVMFADGTLHTKVTEVVTSS